VRKIKMWWLDELQALSHIIEKELKMTFTAYGFASDSPGLRTHNLMDSKLFEKIEKILNNNGYKSDGWKNYGAYPDGVHTNYFVIYIKRD
jgi:hypothetical protein